MTVEHSKDLGHWFRIFKPSKQNQLAPQAYQEFVQPIADVLATARYDSEIQSVVTSNPNAATVSIVATTTHPLAEHHVRILLACSIDVGAVAPPANTFGQIVVTPGIGGANQLALGTATEIDVDRHHAITRPIILPPQVTLVQGLANQSVGVGASLVGYAMWIDVPVGEHILF